jgi:hypothetical protein
MKGDDQGHGRSAAAAACPPRILFSGEMVYIYIFHPARHCKMNTVPPLLDGLGVVLLTLLRRQSTD